jgi:hypothetical protein
MIAGFYVIAWTLAALIPAGFIADWIAGRWTI